MNLEFRQGQLQILDLSNGSFYANFTIKIKLQISFRIGCYYNNVKRYD